MNDYCLRPYIPKGKSWKEVLTTGYNAVEIVDIPPLIKFAGLKSDEVMIVLIEGHKNQAKNNLRMVRVVTNHELGFKIHVNKMLVKTWFIIPRKVALAMNPALEEVLK